MDKEILPCPFCGWRVVRKHRYQNEWVALYCEFCSARGSAEPSEKDAVGKWNAIDRSLSMVAKFHRAFGHPVSDGFSVTNEKVNNLRVELIAEETGELEESLMDAESLSDLDGELDMYDEEVKEAITNTFDALLDIQVVLDGAFLALGFHRYKAAGLAEVHRSNMSKLGEDGKPIYREDGKILKGPNYTPPDLRKVLGL